MTNHMHVGELSQYVAYVETAPSWWSQTVATVLGHAAAATGRLTAALVPFSMLAWIFIAR